MSRNVILKSDESDSALSVNGRIYDLQSIPDYDDPLVLKQKKELLLEIDLDQLNDNLYLSVELLYVAYNGVAGAKGGGLQSAINMLMGDLAILCNECIGTMSTFKTQTDNIIAQLGQTYRQLIRGKEKSAILRLRRCGESSAAMAARADELSVAFIELQKRSVAIRSDTILEEASEYDKKLKAEKAIRDLEAQQKAEKVNQQELVAQVGEMQYLYNEAKAREEKAADKALILGVTSAICGAIGAGLGAYAATKNPVGVLSATATNDADTKKLELAQKTADEKKKKSDEANSKLLEINNKLVPIKSKLATLKKEEKELKTEISIIEGVKEDIRTDDQKVKLNSLITELTKKTKEITDADIEIKKLDGEATLADKSAKDYTAEYGAAAAALNQLSGSMDTMAAAAATAEESIHKEKMMFLEKKFELEAEKRKSLVAMAEFAEGIKNSKIEEGNAEVTVNSLHAAVSALGKIIGTLTNASLFWKQMAQYCTKMTEQGFQSELQDITDPYAGLSQEERIEEYQDTYFMMNFLEYLCQWVALNGLSGEYVVSAARAQKKCVENMGNAATIDEAKLKAPQLAKAMEVMLKQRILDSNSHSSQLLSEQARLEAGKA